MFSLSSDLALLINFNNNNNSNNNNNIDVREMAVEAGRRYEEDKVSRSAVVG